MHRYQHGRDDEGPTRFHYNSDYSGDIVITRGEQECRVPMAALVGFVAEMVREEKKRRYESFMDTCPDIRVVFGEEPPEDNQRR